MKNCKMILNWVIPNIVITENYNIPVLRNGSNYGKCKISIEDTKIIGELSLNDDLNENDFVLYIISIPNEINEMYLEGILLIDYYEGLEKKAKMAKDMIIV